MFLGRQPDETPAYTFVIEDANGKLFNSPRENENCF